MNSSQNLIDSFLKKCIEERLPINFVQVLQEGIITGEYSRMRKCRLPSWSLAKGFASCGIGIAVGEGLINLNEKIIDFFPEYDTTKISEKIPKITLKHLLTMTSGLASPLFFESQESRATKNWFDVFFSAEFSNQPGEKWLYSNFNTYMAACALERRAGMTLLEYMKPRFFKKLGINNPMWETCPMGHTSAAYGLMLDIDELSKYGEMLSHYGEYDGKQIVPKEYMKEASSNLVDNSSLRDEINKDYAGYGYGYQFLLNPLDGFRSEGRYGQFCIAIPSKDTVVTVMAMDNNARRIGAILFEEIITPLSE